MRDLRFLLVLIYFLSFSCPAERSHFHHITSSHGLSSNRVRAVVKDNEGFVWIGTDYGLNKYNGHTITTYHHDAGDTSSLVNSLVWQLFIDQRDRLLIGTQGGLSIYDKELDNFSTLNTAKWGKKFRKLSIRKIVQADNDHLLFGTNKGLIQFNETTGTMYHWGVKDGLPDMVVNDIAKYDEDYYVCTRKGTVKLDYGNQRIVKDWVYEKTKDWIILSIMIDNQRNIWIGTNGNGLCIVDPAERKIREPKDQICNSIIHFITMDRNGDIWLATDGCINSIKAADVIEGKLEFDIIGIDPGNPNSLTNDVISHLYFDDNNWMWVGTMHGGVNLLRDENFPVISYRHNPEAKYSLGHDVVSSFAEESDGTIWISTDGGGLNRFDPKTNRFREFRHDPSNPSGLGTDKIPQLIADGKDGLWLATWGGGLEYFNTQTGKAVKYLYDPNNQSSISSNYVFVPFMDYYGNIWAGTHRGGLCKMIDVNGAFQCFSTSDPENLGFYSDVITWIGHADSSNLWVGTQTDGLMLFDIRKEEFHFNHPFFSHGDRLIDEYIHGLHIDAYKNIWIGTNSSLIFYSPKLDLFKKFGIRDGLNSTKVMSILRYSDDEMWFATSEGLTRCKLHVHSDSVGFAFSNFNEKDGLPNNDYRKYSALSSKSGEIYFGGLLGFSRFHPDSLAPEYRTSKLYFRDFYLFNQSVQVGDEDGILNKHLNSTEILKLNNHQNSFGIDYCFINYHNPEKVEFRYQLSGFDEEWIYAGNARRANYTNIPPGEYRFRLNSIYDNSVVEENERSFLIVIKPAFWQRVHFRIASVLLVILVIFAMYKVRINGVQRRNVKLENTVAERTEKLNTLVRDLQERDEEIQTQNEELQQAHTQLSDINQRLESLVKIRTANLVKANQELDRFVYSASHDLSAPLKSLLGLIHIAKLEGKEKKMEEHLGFMEKSVLKLDRVIKSLTQFSRNTGWEIKAEKIVFTDLVSEVLDDLQSLRKDHKVEITKDYEDDEVFYSDFYRLKIILLNILSNSIKYMSDEDEKGWIKLSFRQTGKRLFFRVEDNGIGIPPGMQDKVFEMFYRATEKSQGSGLGLYIVREMVNKLGGKISLSSKEQIGTTVEISLPKKKIITA